MAAMAAIALSGCASTTLNKVQYSSYRLGVEQTSTIGAPFIVDQKGQVATVRQWVGLLNSSNGYAVREQYSADYLRRELLYSGRSGSTVEITYREFRGGMAAQPFYQNLKYDLSASSQIRFQNFAIDVIAADNQSIRYKIVSDR
jgi:hypothetical protein